MVRTKSDLKNHKLRVGESPPFFIFQQDKSMSFTDKFTFSGLDSENLTSISDDGILSGHMVFSFNYGDTKSDDKVSYNVEFVFYETSILMSLLVQYKDARFIKELQKSKRFYTNLKDMYGKESNEYKKYSQEKYVNDIFYRFRPNMDVVDAFFDLVGFDYIDNLVNEHFGELNNVLRQTIVKIFN